MKSCFKCRNQNICKHKTNIFDKFEIYSSFINLIAEGIGERCKYFAEFTEEEKEIKKMSESNYAKQTLPKWQKEHPNARVMRNNTGMAWQGRTNPHPIFFGIGLPTKNKSGRTVQKGGGDYIGWESIEIAKPCCGICGNIKNCNLIYNKIYPYYKEKGLIFIYETLQNHVCEIWEPDLDKTEKIAVFLNLEIKSKDGKESPEQIKFRKAVQAAGGISIVLQEGKDENKI